MNLFDWYLLFWIKPLLEMHWSYRQAESKMEE